VEARRLAQYGRKLSLHELRRGARINAWCGFGELYWKSCSTETWKMMTEKGSSVTPERYIRTDRRT